MKILNLDKYKQSNKLYAITILGMKFDLRRWYQIWVKKGEDAFDKELVGWVGAWISWYELQDDLWYDIVEPDESNELCKYVKRETPKNLKYKKIPLIFTICNWSSWWYKNKKLLAGILIGFLLSLLIQY